MLVECAGIRIAPAIMEAGPDAFDGEVCRALGLDASCVRSISLRRRSIDARKKGDVRYVVTVLVDVPTAESLADLPRTRNASIALKPFEPAAPIVIPDRRSAAARKGRPLVVGAGPAGLFCALYLARAGLQPILVERGEPVEQRSQTIARFVRTGLLDPDSNIQFGEGGAGTYSDGKLTTGTRSPFARFVLEELVAAGAPASILIDAKPHVGTDHLGRVARGLRDAIIEAGGEVRFRTRLEGIGIAREPGGTRRVEEALLRDVGTGRAYRLPAEALVLAIGHSARDAYAMLEETGVALERKQFAVGVRIEHPQFLIDCAQYGRFADSLPPADYKLSMHTEAGRGVYTFCMCPGGEVVAGASEEGGVCVNGMSRYARDGAQANSALLVEVRPDDLPGEGVLAGVAFQRELERSAFRAASDLAAYAAPAQRLGDFMGMPRKAGRPQAPSVVPTYPRGVRDTRLDGILPAFVVDSLREAIPVFDRRLRGFADPEALLTAVEARSSAPVRILRDGKTLQSTNVAGLYPAGEGAGYAGGIMSAAADGLRIAARLADDAEGVR